jgi:hypothetical protein
VVGLVGGVGGGSAVAGLIGADGASLVGSLIGGAGGGAVLTAVVGILKNKFMS